MFRTTNEIVNTVAECTWTDWTDEELLLEYRCTGIREAFDELVHRYERELYKYLYYYLGNSANADDVFQKTFMVVLQECDTFNADRAFRPWLYRIATNEAVNHLRKAKQKRYSMVSMDAPMGSDGKGYCIADTVAGHEPEPFEDPMDREIAGKVRAAVDALPEQMRQAIYMVYFQGLSYRETADAVGIPFGTLSGRLNKGIEKLNFLLKNVG